MTLPELAPWQARAFGQADAALAAGHLGHGLLVTGPEGIGKRIVAEHLARRLLCLQPTAGGQACGSCRGCTLFQARAQHQPPETRPDGTPAHPWGHATHPDLLLLGYEWNNKSSPPRMRTEIVIEQIRALTEQLALTPQLGQARVAIIDPVDAVNWNAFNALLKTLEEPRPGRHLLLLSTAPTRLPATIRSRCQRLELRLPPRAEALAWLQAQDIGDGSADEALEAARGDPGLAAKWLAGDGLALRDAVARDVGELEGGRVLPSQLLKPWTEDGRAAERLAHLADLALSRASAGLTDAAATRRLAARFEAANRCRALLRSTVRADLVVAEALQGWSPGESRRER